jgi:hypothetical protein
MSDAIAKRIAQVVSKFDNYSWYSWEIFPPLYLVQDINTKTTLQLSEYVLWDLMEISIDKLEDSELYKILKAIENQETAKQFVQKLSEDQKPIPVEFAKVLNDNFWELM